jgi:GTP cyclohydrolase II
MPLIESQKPKLALPHRDSALDPLLIAAASASGPHVTRNHYHHDFFPSLPRDNHRDPSPHRKRLTYISRQAPRRIRLQLATPLSVTCMARTRIPTAHGTAFLHLYHNSRDAKEHLALVIDPAQLDTDHPPLAQPIRSRSLDAVWNPEESDMDRITRGAYIGRLSPSTHTPSKSSPPSSTSAGTGIPPPLIRVHSECFTGETVGSMRCDCGEQLDESIRLISQPQSNTIPGRGAVIYLRQEGRGIGLLSKLRAYNLQDLGHDTVSANLLLGHQADERSYDVAAAILRDLGLGEVRVLTNNPDKVRALEREGVKVVERVGMVPQSWKRHGVPSSGKTVYGEDLDKYLRTKVLRMGHLLSLEES